MPVVRPGVIREKIIVDGNIDSVFEFISDFSNVHLWDPGVNKSTPDTNYDRLMITIGTSYRLEVEFNGNKMVMDYTITKYEAPNEVVLEGEGDHIRAIDSIKFKQIENGKVEIDYEVNLTLKGWLRPFILFLYSSLNKLGRTAKSGIENYFKYKNKNGLLK